jgi:hypothetical protein
MKSPKKKPTGAKLRNWRVAIMRARADLGARLDYWKEAPANGRDDRGSATEGASDGSDARNVSELGCQSVKG